MDCIDRVGSFTLISLLPSKLMVGLLMEVPVTPAIDTPHLTLQLLQDSLEFTLPLVIAILLLDKVTKLAMLRHYWRQFALRPHPGAYQKVIEQRRLDSFRLPQLYQLHCSCSLAARSTCGCPVAKMASLSS